MPRIFGIKPIVFHIIVDFAARRDHVHDAFDTTDPTNSDADVAATGSADFAARRDHKHAITVAAPTVTFGAGTYLPYAATAGNTVYLPSLNDETYTTATSITATGL